jgi:predicted Zn-dependent protease
VTDDRHAPQQLELAERVLDLVDDRAEAQVRVVRGRHGLTRFANSFIHQHVGEDVTRVSLTVAKDGRVASGTTSRLDDLPTFVDATLEAARVAPVDPHWPGLTPPTEVTDHGHADDATAEADPDERAARVRAFVDAAPDLRAAGFVDTEAAWVAYANNAGHRASGRATRATGDGIHQTDTSAGSGHATSVRLADIDGAAIGALAAERARASADFTDLEPGRYEVVLSNEAVATIAVFLGVYGFNAKSYLEGASFASLGEAQFDEAVTLVDDPTDPEMLGHGFDAEGVPGRRLPLIERGVTANLVHDRRTAKRMGGDAATTGHGLPGGGGFGPVPTHLRLEPGTTSRDDLVAGVERGLLITTFNYCRVLDPRTQVVTGLTRNGTFLVEDGRIAGAVGNLRFTQSFVEALGPGNVLGVGDDLRHADSEFGAGAVMAPSVRLASWNFSGGASG